MIELGALLLFGVAMVCLVLVAGVILKAVLWVVLLPIRVLFWVIGTLLLLPLLLIKLLVGGVIFLIALPILLVVFVVAAVAVAAAVLIPAIPLIFLIALIWFYALALGLLAGAVINALRFELHDTGTLRGMTADFPAQRPPDEKREHDWLP